jgi:tetratricopeptide (TPR) repeat protein
LELVPEDPAARNFLGRVYLAGKRLEESLSEMEKVRERDWQLHGLAIAYHALGREKDAEAALNELITRDLENGNMDFQVAQVCSQLRKKKEAFDWLERAYKNRDSGLGQTKLDPLMRPIAGEPEFAAFLKKVNFE